MTPPSIFRLLPEISQAILEKKPVVALESSIIAQGMPYPINIETAFSCEKIIRDQGAIPATIAVMNKKICVGLSSDEIEYLGKKSTVVHKLSRRDLGYALAQNLTGATTVSSTMIAAYGAGIPIFATGGIGGVHRNGESTLDISADLDELGRTPVAVISSGVKSILDIGRTMEVLETKGVPIIGYQTKDFPAFFCRSSNFKTDCIANTALGVAQILKMQWQIFHPTGVLIANPVPERFALDEHEIEERIKEAIKLTERENIQGKKVTPYLLAYLAEKTNYQTLTTNVELVKNNAHLAAEIACAYFS